MDNLVKQLYSEYGKYINQYRSFPSVLDGCKLVERRLLYSLYEVARKNFVKSAKVVGHCIAKYHPHGDESAYQSLVGLVQNDFAIGQGNWGHNAGIESSPAAAQRYTEVKSSIEILNSSFEFINSVPFEELELESEPLFLPSKFPLCLLGNNYTQGMGFGYRTLIPCYKKQDLFKRLQWILDGKNGDGPVIKPISDCKLLSKKSDYLTLLTTGKAKIEMKGIYKVEDKKSIVINSVPHSKNFSTILKKLEKEILIDKSLGWQDETTNTTKVRFTIIKPRMLKMDQLKKKIESILTGSVTFDCNMCNTSGKVVLVSVDDMLFKIYTVYKKVISYVLTENIKELDLKISELNLIGNIKPILSQELKNNPDNLELVTKNISSKLKVELDVIGDLLSRYTISRLFKIKTDTNDILSKKKETEKQLKNINNYIWKEKYLK